MSSSAIIPGDASPDDFYDATPLEPLLLYQGEILVDVPILNIEKPSRWQLVRTRSGKRLDEALKHGNIGGTVNVLDSNMSKEEWQADKRGDYVIALLDKNPVLVLNQTCDIQTKSFLQVAPIYPAQEGERYLGKLMNGDIYSAFWLKKHPPELNAHSYADLELIQAVHKSFLKRMRPQQHFRLSAARIRLLQHSVTRYFGRPNSYDSRSDRAPTTGTYLCLDCFYMGGRLTSVALGEGSDIPICVTCEGIRWAIKGR